MFVLNFVVTLSSFLFLCFISSSYSIEIRPLRKDRDFAAEITHVSLEDIDDATFDLLHYALLKYKVVVVRNQPDFSVEGQRRFTKRFGHLHVHLESSSHLPGYQDVNVVSNIKNENGSYIGLFGKHVENFHSDLSW
jgi:alpha-ketoglutarate-dependent taurine dioxygenase